jgi:hypothetical protein
MDKTTGEYDFTRLDEAIKTHGGELARQPRAGDDRRQWQPQVTDFKTVKRV